MRFLLCAAFAFVALHALRWVLQWLQLRQARFRRMVRAEIVDASDLPAELAPVFEEAARQLGELGFEPSHAQWMDALNTNEPRRPARVFLHPPTCTYAEVTPPIFQNGRRLYSVAFTSFFEAGPAITTLDALLHLTPLVPTDRMLRDECVNDVAAQWAGHACAVAERASSDAPLLLSPADYVDRQTRSFADAIEHGRQQALLNAPAHGTYRFTRVAALHATRAALAGARVLARRERTHPVVPAGADAAWLAADEYVFRRAEAQPLLPLDRRTKIQLFAASAVIAAVALGLLVSWSFVPAVLVVLLLHELGHVGGMWLFGYRDRQIVFVPFLGAAAFGRKHDASPLKRVTVLLLGPVPGIALGLLCLRLADATGWPLLQAFALTAIVLNYINLLPITPLDGGRIVEVLLLNRFPRAGVAFLLTSAVAAGLAGVAAGDPILIVLSIALLAALPGRWLIARAAADTRRRLRGFPSRSDRIRAAFRALDARPKPVAAAARVPLARAVVEQLDAPYAATPLVLGGAALYGLLLVAPVAITALVLIPNPAVADLCLVDAEARAAGANAAAYGHALADVCADPNFPELKQAAQWKTLVDRGAVRLADGDSSLATQYYRLAQDAAVFAFDDDDPRRVATRSLVQELIAAEQARLAAAVAAAAATDAATATDSEDRL
jgi:Zn-dependent protease